MNKIVRTRSATSWSIERNDADVQTCNRCSSAERKIAEHEMTKHIVQLPNPDGSLLLRELDHRIKNELTPAIYAVSAKAVQSDSVAVKAALLDVADLLHQCADVHRALHMPDQKGPIDAGRSLERLCFSVTKSRLDR